MHKPASTPWLALLIAAAALFVWQTSRDLPLVVATHFGAAGTANGFMTRRFYLWFMLVFVVLLPLALNLALGRALRSPQARLNLPDADYWQADGRREAAVALVLRYMKGFAALLILFLCYVHWLVIRANAVTPPLLDGARLTGGLAVFLLALIVWIVLLRRNFRRPARPPEPRP